MDGPLKYSITPAADSINNTLRYDFNIPASDDPKKNSIIFQCRSRDEGSHRIELTFGEQVNDVYSKAMTMVYHKPR